MDKAEAAKKIRSCKYCGGGHGSADHAHTPSMKKSEQDSAKKKADFTYKAEAHNRRAQKLRDNK